MGDIFKEKQYKIFIKLVDFIFLFGRIFCSSNEESIEVSQEQSTIFVLDNYYNKNDQSFEFDAAFGPDSTQKQFYEGICKDIIPGVFEGLGATIIAYGQTGSGKVRRGVSFQPFVHCSLLGFRDTSFLTNLLYLHSLS